MIGALLVGVPIAGAEPKPTVAQVEARVDALRAQAETNSEQYNETREELAALRVRVTAARSREVQQKAQIAKTRRQLGRLAAELYRKGDLYELQVFLSDDPDAVLGRMGLSSSLGERRDNLVARLTEGQKQLAADTAAVTKQEQKVAAAEVTLKAKKAEIERNLAAADAQLAQLREDERREVERLAQQREQAAIAKALAEATAEAEAEERAEAAARKKTTTTRTTSSSGGSSGSSADDDSDDDDSADDDTGGGTGTTVNCGGRSVKAPTARVVTVLRYACGQIGEPYSWGADGPGSWDCSGLTMMAWKQVGRSLPHSSKLQAGYGSRVSRSNLRPGDLVFFNSPISHVGIYIGSGLMVHAPRTGRNVGVAALLSNYAGGVRL
jgi:cell wall-associated NlpC family hydrolase